MSWLEGPLAGFDTETTGVDVTSDRIVTAALVRREGGRDTVQAWLINPGVEIPEAAAAIHGITTEYASEFGRAPWEALAEIGAAVAANLSDGVPLVAFNAAFDLSLLDAELTRYHLPTVAQRLGREVRPVLDPLVLDRGLDRYRKGKRTLTDLCLEYQILDAGQMHTADVDVAATLDVLHALAARYPNLGETTLEALHDYQVAEHRRWAERFNAWRLSQGYSGEAASAIWPMRPYTTTDVKTR